MDVKELYNLDRNSLYEILTDNFKTKEELIGFLDKNKVTHKKSFGYKRLVEHSIDFIHRVGVYRRIAGYDVGYASTKEILNE